MADFKLPVLTCKRCGHQWFPRKPDLPVQCPNCKSPYWNRERSNNEGRSQTRVVSASSTHQGA